MFLEISDLKKSFGEGDSKVQVLKGIDLSVDKGEICVLLGPSGSGKSTLLNIIGGIDSPDSGYVSIDGEKMVDMTERRLYLVFVRMIWMIILSILKNMQDIRLKQNVPDMSCLVLKYYCTTQPMVSQ